MMDSHRRLTDGLFLGRHGRLQRDTLPRRPALHPRADLHAILVAQTDAEAVAHATGHRPTADGGLVDLVAAPANVVVSLEVQAVGIGALQGVGLGVAAEAGALDDRLDVGLPAQFGGNDLLLPAAARGREKEQQEEDGSPGDLRQSESHDRWQGPESRTHRPQSQRAPMPRV